MSISEWRAEARWSVRAAAADFKLPSLASTRSSERVLRHTGVVMPPGFRHRGVVTGLVQKVFLLLYGFKGTLPVPRKSSVHTIHASPSCSVFRLRPRTRSN